MSFVVYIFVLLIALTSVLFGLDWAVTPPPAHQYVPPKVAQLPIGRPEPPSTLPPSRTADATPEASKPAAPVVRQTANPAIATEGNAAPQAIAAAPKEAAPLCDVSACTAAYRSFTASDCTYQPLEGPRILCTKGKPPQNASAAAPPSAATPANGPLTPTPEQAKAIVEAQERGNQASASSAASCNVQACSAAYHSFTASDCTYQPSEGPRRLCTRQ